MGGKGFFLAVAVVVVAVVVVAVVVVRFRSRKASLPQLDSFVNQPTWWKRL